MNYMKKKLYILLPLLMFFSFSCNEFLDELPDNRTEANTDDKITKLLTSAYASNLFVLTTEMSSDNFDDFGNTFNSVGRIQEQLFRWENVTDNTGNESPKEVWASYYLAIAHANQALLAMEKMGNPAGLNPQRGEALISRAYHHFILVNVFCKHYSEQTGAIDMGIPYMEKAETTVNPQYERGTVAGVYEKIEKDIEEALPLISDDIYTVPKYHFNRKAAYAFASRFYLFYRKYDKVIEYANEVLGSDPTNVLRDVKALSNLTTDYEVISKEYIKPGHHANLLLMTGYSNLGAILGHWTSGKRFMFSTSLLSRQEVMTPGPWGNTMPYLRELAYNYGPMGFSSVGKLPYLFEYTDPVAGIGFPHTVLVALGTDEVLLNRAEAYIWKGDYDNATADIGIWVSHHLNGARAPSRSAIHTFYDKLAYYTSLAPTPKKRLHLEVPVASPEQESFLHCILHIRRIELLFEGLRWFDVKRYGIEITRRTVDANTTIRETDKLTVDDPRRAIQLPADIITAGLTPNPR
jgi:tetratricopeptide (TPR) repeat protein